jgi:hypothetical protein
MLNELIQRALTSLQLMQQNCVDPAFHKIRLTTPSSVFELELDGNVIWDWYVSGRVSRRPDVTDGRHLRLHNTAGKLLYNAIQSAILHDLIGQFSQLN